MYKPYIRYGSGYMLKYNKITLEVYALNKLVLIDGNSLSFRAFYALPLLSNKAGIHTNAVYGFAMLLEKIMREEQPSLFSDLRLTPAKQHLDIQNIVNIKAEDKSTHHLS